MENKKRLIDANSILDDFLKRYTEMERDGKLVFAACEIKQDFADMISNAPTIDAVPVVHAKYDSNHYCTNCGEMALEAPYPGTYYHTLYCWACNAKMDNGFGIGDVND